MLLKTQIVPEIFGRKTLTAKGRIRRFGRFIKTLLLSLLFAGIAAVIYLGMARALGPVGLLSLISMSAMAGGVFTCFISTVRSADGILFQFDSYDLDMSLPLRTEIIVASRLVVLYWSDF